MDPCFPSHVCKLHKFIYGLKQAPRAWFDRFSGYLVGIGFSRTHTDSSLFVRSSNGSLTILLLYVDDLVLTGNDACDISFLISQLSVVFEMKILGHLHHFLGIEFNLVSNGLFLSQVKYAKDLLVCSSMIDAKPCGSLSCHIQSSSPSASHLLTDPTPYRSVTGALQYLTLTRPDLAFAVNQLCQHLHQPTTADYTALKRVLRYLKGSLTSGISFQRGSLHLIGYSNADWAGDPMDRPSTSGFCIFLGGSPIS